MLTIREYTLPTSGQRTFDLPGGATLVSVCSYANGLRLHLAVEPANELVERTFLVLRTNEAIDYRPDCLDPLGSVVVDGVVRHVVEVV